MLELLTTRASERKPQVDVTPKKAETLADAQRPGNPSSGVVPVQGGQRALDVDGQIGEREGCGLEGGVLDLCGHRGSPVRDRVRSSALNHRTGRRPNASDR